MAPGDAAGVIAGLAGAADIRAAFIDAAGCRLADLTDQGRASVADTAHARACLIDEFGRNPIEIGVVFHREARPVPGVGAARAASLAIEVLLRKFFRPAQRGHVVLPSARGHARMKMLIG